MLNILFTGDFAPCRRFEEIVTRRGADIFGDLLPDIQKADLSFLNLECILSESTVAIDKAGPALKAGPACIKALSTAGFDVVGLANNHVMDYGAAGLFETMSICEKEAISHCGAGRTIAEARQPLVVERQGIKIAIIAVAEHEFSIASDDTPGAAPLDPVDNLLQIEAAKAAADLVFVTIHGGNEYFPLPRPGLRKLCKFFIDRGVDAVICHHPHVPGSYEEHNGKPVFYSIGNLIFDNEAPPKDWDKGYAINFQYDTASRQMMGYSLIPYEQSIVHQGLKKLSAEASEIFFQTLNSYRQILNDHTAYQKHWQQFCQSKTMRVLTGNYVALKIPGMYRLYKMKWFRALFFPASHWPRRLNMIQCESHHELLTAVLENQLGNKPAINNSDGGK